MASSRFVFATIFILFSLLFHQVYSQQVLNLSDKQKISLALDYIRKGIQQEDVKKILVVCAPELLARGGSNNSKAKIADTLTNIFKRSVQRAIEIPKPSLSSPESHLNNSGFWDFDIIKPEIKIIGDTAWVEYQLILWGAPADSGSGVRRSRGTFRFAVLPGPDRPLITDDDFIPASKDYDSDSIPAARVWKLIDLDNGLDFLTSAIADKGSEK